MTRHPLFGLGLAASGALLLSPDTLFMRLSGMSGVAMLAWRGGLMGTVFLLVWALTARTRQRRDLAALASGAGLAVVFGHACNSILFSLAIAAAPVSVVLFGVATVPVFAALFAGLILGEPTRRATWVTMVAVLSGIALAVFGGEGGNLTLDIATLIGAVGGLGVAVFLALSFVVLRATPGLSILLTMGLGSLIGGLAGLWFAGPAALDGAVWAIAVSGALLLPLSFFALSFASRFTPASNVSLLLLLETVLGPVVVWTGTGEAPTPAMVLGGALVVTSLATYLWYAGRRVPLTP